MGHVSDKPFASIESAQEFIALLFDTVVEAKRDVEADISSPSTEQSRRVDALKLASVHLHNLEHHIIRTRRILNDLRLIDAAVDQYAIETNRATGAVVGTADWANYLKKGSLLYNTGKSILGSPYGAQTVDTIPAVPAADYSVLSDVAGAGFWSPYGP